MSESVIFLLITVGVMSLLGGVVVVMWPYIRGTAGGSLTSGVNSRGGMADDFQENKSRVSQDALNTAEFKVQSSALDLDKKLIFAQWKMTKITYKIYTAILTAIFFLIAYLKLYMLWWVVAALFGPGLMSFLLNRAIMKRFNQFDRDYAPFLLALVGLLRTGMNPLQALSSAASQLEPDSLVRFEVELMLERIRVGAPEDKSVGAFGNDINHPEIELFVQALLLSMRVGGTLSDTLERLSKQVRRRQFFRSQAVSAVGLQRGSIWFIIIMQVALMTFIYFSLPQFVMDSINHPIGWMIWQTGVLIMVVAIYWVSQVSKIRC